jgi:hypothetical protein
MGSIALMMSEIVEFRFKSWIKIALPMYTSPSSSSSSSKKVGGSFLANYELKPATIIDGG